jgi:hypothetical protein
LQVLVALYIDKKNLTNKSKIKRKRKTRKD